MRAGAPPRSAVLLAGIIPPPAPSYFRRQETGLALRDGLHPGATVVLAGGDETASAPAAHGGTGKTQLAAEYARALCDARAVEVLAWVTAVSRDAVVAGFAQAAVVAGAGDHRPDAEAAAVRFVAWLAHTRRPWALVIDGLRDPADLDGLWPSGPAGQVVITTRLPAHAMESAAAANSGGALRVVPVGGFSRREALSYLGSGLTDHPDQRVEALDLGEDLDGLPLALAHAAAVMKVSGLGCREYRARLAERREHLSGVRVDGVSATVLATWSLAAECAHGLAPAGLAWPGLALAAMLDPHGIPAAVLACPAAYGYIAGRPVAAGPADQGMVRAALTNLARAGLVSIDPASPVRTVRMHPSVQAAVRAYLPPADLEQAMLAAADALIQAWPQAGDQAQLDQAFRDCAAALGAAEGGPLWKPEAHPLLVRTGVSLEEGRLAGAAVTYWQTVLDTSTRLLGAAHADAVAARDRLAAAYESAGRFGDAIAVFSSALADRERHQGYQHPDTITARGQLAHAYFSAGRPAEAAALYEQTAADAGRRLGREHPVTLTARSCLAEAYLAAGRGRESVAAYRMLVTDSEAVLGPRHRTTLAAREHLADAILADGQGQEAVEHYARLLADAEAAGGRDHLDAIAARASLASAFRRSGKPKSAVTLCERVLADRERVQGPDHLDTITARGRLASAYRDAGQLREAIRACDRTLADRERVQGADHADTRAARVSLAAACHQAGRLGDAIRQYEQALADSERVLGPADPQTLTIRSGLAAVYQQAGRLSDAIRQYEQGAARHPPG